MEDIFDPLSEGDWSSLMGLGSGVMVKEAGINNGWDDDVEDEAWSVLTTGDKGGVMDIACDSSSSELGPDSDSPPPGVFLTRGPLSLTVL